MRALTAGCLVVSCWLLPGCASILSGTNQPISVETPDCEGANCKLTNDNGTWFVKAPGSVTVSRAYGDLTVSCSKDGFGEATNTVQSSTKAMLAGNIIFGGVIGGGVDVATGAAYDYPALITNPLSCKSPADEVPNMHGPAVPGGTYTSSAR
jgi:hypothetical protein